MSTEDRRRRGARSDEAEWEPAALDVYPDGVFAQSSRYDALEGENGRTTIFDRDNPKAWIRSEVAIALDDGFPMR
jgi:hypothetical protein